MKIRDYKLHELGYTYSGQSTLYSLTPLEVSFLFGGGRELDKIQVQAQKMEQRRAKMKGKR